MANKKFDHFVDELETQFQSIHKKLSKAREDYVARHKKDFDKAKKQVDSLKKQLAKAKAKSTKAAAEAKKSGSKAVQNQWKKTKAAASLLSTSLKEASHIMTTAEEKLKTAKPFDKKLAAREKALHAFEKEWTIKMKKEEERKAKRAAQAKAKKKKAKPKTKASPKTKSTTEQNSESTKAI